MELTDGTRAVLTATIGTLTMIAVVAMYADRVGNLIWYAFRRLRR